MKINITPEDMKAGEPIDNGWYKCEVVEVLSKPSKDGNSVNHIATCQLEGYKDNDSKVVARFNSKAIAMIKPFLAALAGKTLAQFIDENKSGVDFEFEQVKGGKLQIQVENKLYEGRYIPEVKNYAPYNYQVPF